MRLILAWIVSALLAVSAVAQDAPPSASDQDASTVFREAPRGSPGGPATLEQILRQGEQQGRGPSAVQGPEPAGGTTSADTSGDAASGQDVPSVSSEAPGGRPGGRVTLEEFLEEQHGQGAALPQHPVTGDGTRAVETSGVPAVEQTLSAEPAGRAEAVKPDVANDPTQWFPDAPEPPSGAAEGGTGLLRAMVQQLSSAATTVCAGRGDCARVAGNFARFLWDNRDRVDVQTRALRCLGQSAVRRGYVQSPVDAIRNASRADVTELSVEVCECMVGLSGSLSVCRPSLVQGRLAPLLRMFGR